MPYRRRYRRRRRVYRRRRRYFRRRRRGGRRTRLAVRKMPTLFPDRCMVKFKTTLSISPIDVSGSFFNTYFINSLLDPFGTSGTITACGLSAWSTFYARYKVHACRINVRFMFSGVESGIFAIFPSRNLAIAATTASEASQLRYAKSMQFQGANSGRSSLSNMIGIKKLYGEPLWSVNFSSSVGSSPAHLMYFHTVGSVTDGSANELIMNVTLWQSAVLYNPNDITS